MLLDDPGGSFFSSVNLIEIPVKEFPWPWNPFKCGWKERFEARATAEMSDAQRAAAFASVVGELTEGELARCPFHAEIDWKLAADLAVQLHRNGQTPSDRNFEDWAGRNGARQAELEAVWSFWVYPISWSRGSDFVGDGQHRICGLKVAGADLALVEA